MLTVGDVHGNLNYLEGLAKTRPEQNIFQVGDLGLGFILPSLDKKNLERFNDLLEETDKYFYAIRGNHDDPEFWSGKYTDRWSRIMLIPDFSVVEIEGRNVLCIGGAISLDRQIRKHGMDYWEDEKFVMDRKRLEKCLELEIHIVVTHTAPNFAFPLGFGFHALNYAKEDKKLLEDIRVERNQLAEVWDEIKKKSYIPTHWMYGHFHQDHEEFLESTKFICLGKGSLEVI